MPVACIVVPHGSAHPEHLAAAVRAHQRDWEVAAVWAGDPQLEPAFDGLTRAAPPADELAQVATDSHAWEWRCAADAATQLLTRGEGEVVLLWAGACAVLGPLEPLVGSRAPLTLVPRVVGALPDDDLAPGEPDLVRAGPFSTSVAVARSTDVCAWLSERITADPGVEVGPLLARAAQAFGADICDHESIGAGIWRWPEGDVALVDLPSFDADQPWVLAADVPNAARVDVVGRPAVRAVLDAARAQLGGRRPRLCLPGGTAVDGVVRVLVRSATPSPPLPWSQPEEFRRWLEARYWLALHERRRDLAAAFPDPVVGHRRAFADWTRSAFAHDDVPFLLAPEGASTARLQIADERRDDGLNLVGYLTRESSLGDVARRLLDGLASAEVPVSTIATQRTGSPPVRDAPAPDQRVAFDTSLAIVTADQFPLLARDFPELFEATRRMIGYWFWELEHIPEHMRGAMSLVDEIWAGSRFVADAFAAVAAVPVRHVPIPVPEPTASERARAEFPPLASAGNRFVFVTAFDHLSVTERKNPLGSIEAFRRAFAPGEGPLLLVKTMNARVRWVEHQRIAAAAEDRPDIVLWDEHLGRADQMALVRAADCLVSLHRSEGLGLHLAEAMWLGTPTIATRYSGNVDFMDDSCSFLVDHELVPVTRGQGVYPPTARWAEPDLDMAADAMRRLVASRELHGRIAVAARARMKRQPSLKDTGRLVADLLRA